MNAAIENLFHNIPYEMSFKMSGTICELYVPLSQNPLMAISVVNSEEKADECVVETMLRILRDYYYNNNDIFFGVVSLNGFEEECLKCDACLIDCTMLRKLKDKDDIIGEFMYEKCISFHRINQIWPTDGVLGEWCRYQESEYSKKTINPLLDEIIKNRGIVPWRDEKDEILWNEQYDKILLCVKGENSKPSVKEHSQWIDWYNTQKQLWKKGKLSDRQLKKFGCLSTLWENDEWESNYALVCDYVKNKGYYPFDIKGIGEWFSRVYRLFLNNEIKGGRYDDMQDLNRKLPFPQKDEDWIVSFEKYKKAVEENIPVINMDNDSLYWINEQLEMKKSHMLERERCVELSNAGVNFYLASVQTEWMESFIQVRDWFRKYNSIPLPDEENGDWCMDQREMRKLRRLNILQNNLLQSINFNWNGIDAKWWECFTQFTSSPSDGSNARENDQISRKLRYWTNQNRLEKFKNNIESTKLELLNKFHFQWDEENINTQHNLELLRLFYGSAPGEKSILSEELKDWCNSIRENGNDKDTQRRLEGYGFKYDEYDYEKLVCLMEPLHIYRSLHGDWPKENEQEPALVATIKGHALHNTMTPAEKRVFMEYSLMTESRQNEHMKEVYTFLKAPITNKPDMSNEAEKLCHRIRMLKAKGKLDDNTIHRLEQSGFVWEISTERWIFRLNQSIALRNKIGDWPVLSDGETGRWWVTQMRKLNMGKLSEFREKALKEIGIEENTQDNTIWKSKYDELVHFILQNGYWPQEGNKLKKWCDIWVERYINGGLRDNAKSAKIKKLTDSFYVFKDREDCEKMICICSGLYKKYGYWPTGGKDKPSEFCDHLRLLKKNGILPVVFTQNPIFETFDWDIHITAAWLKRFIEYRDFILTQGKRPSSKSINNTEKEIESWAQSQVASLLKGELSKKKLYMLISTEQMYPGVESKNTAPYSTLYSLVSFINIPWNGFKEALFNKDTENIFYKKTMKTIQETQNNMNLPESINTELELMNNEIQKQSLRERFNEAVKVVGSWYSKFYAGNSLKQPWSKQRSLAKYLRNCYKNGELSEDMIQKLTDMKFCPEIDNFEEKAYVLFSNDRTKKNTKPLEKSMLVMQIMEMLKNNIPLPGGVRHLFEICSSELRGEIGNIELKVQKIDELRVWYDAFFSEEHVLPTDYNPRERAEYMREMFKNKNMSSTLEKALKEMGFCLELPDFENQAENILSFLPNAKSYNDIINNDFVRQIMDYDRKKMKYPLAVGYLQNIIMQKAEKLKQEEEIRQLVQIAGNWYCLFYADRHFKKPSGHVSQASVTLRKMHEANKLSQSTIDELREMGFCLEISNFENNVFSLMNWINDSVNILPRTGFVLPDKIRKLTKANFPLPRAVKYIMDITDYRFHMAVEGLNPGDVYFENIRDFYQSVLSRENIYDIKEDCIKKAGIIRKMYSNGELTQIQNVAYSNIGMDFCNVKFEEDVYSLVLLNAGAKDRTWLPKEGKVYDFIIKTRQRIREKTADKYEMALAGTFVFSPCDLIMNDDRKIPKDVSDWWSNWEKHITLPGEEVCDFMTRFRDAYNDNRISKEMSETAKQLHMECIRDNFEKRAFIMHLSFREKKEYDYPGNDCNSLSGKIRNEMLSAFINDSLTDNEKTLLNILNIDFRFEKAMTDCDLKMDDFRDFYISPINSQFEHQLRKRNAILDFKERIRKYPGSQKKWDKLTEGKVPLEDNHYEEMIQRGRMDMDYLIENGKWSDKNDSQREEWVRQLIQGIPLNMGQADIAVRFGYNVKDCRYYEDINRLLTFLENYDSTQCTLEDPYKASRVMNFLREKNKNSLH